MEPGLPGQRYWQAGPGYATSAIHGKAGAARRCGQTKPADAAQRYGGLGPGLPRQRYWQAGPGYATSIHGRAGATRRCGQTKPADAAQRYGRMGSRPSAQRHGQMGQWTSSPVVSMAEVSEAGDRLGAKEVLG